MFKFAVKMLLMMVGVCSSFVQVKDIDQNVWLTCGTCGNSAGSTATAKYSAVVGRNAVSEDGNDTMFSIAAKAPFANAYFYQVHAPISGQLSYLSYEFDLYIPNAVNAPDAPQALEFECQQTFAGWTYNMAWQANYPQNVWRTFDYSLKRWEPSGLTFTHFSPNMWHHIVAEFHTDAALHEVWFDALTVDGNKHLFQVMHAAVHTGEADKFTNAFQLDSNSHMTPYTVYIDHMFITAVSTN